MIWLTLSICPDRMRTGERFMHVYSNDYCLVHVRENVSIVGTLRREANNNTVLYRMLKDRRLDSYAKTRRGAVGRTVRR